MWLQALSEMLAQLFTSGSGHERTPLWSGGAIVFGSMAAVIVGLVALRWV